MVVEAGGFHLGHSTARACAVSAPALLLSVGMVPTKGRSRGSMFPCPVTPLLHHLPTLSHPRGPFPAERRTAAGSWLQVLWMVRA